MQNNQPKYLNEVFETPATRPFKQKMNNYLAKSTREPKISVNRNNLKLINNKIFNVIENKRLQIQNIERYRGEGTGGRDDNILTKRGMEYF